MSDTNGRLMETLRELSDAVRGVNPQLASRLERLDLSGELAKDANEQLHGGRRPRDDVHGTHNNVAVHLMEERLERLLSNHRARSVLADEARAVMEEQADEYEREAARLSELLYSAGLPRPTLPASNSCGESRAGEAYFGGEALALVAGVANELDLSTCSEVSLQVAWGLLALEDMTAAQTKTTLSRKRSEIQRLLRRAEEGSRRLDASLEEAATRLGKGDRQLAQQVLPYAQDMPLREVKYRDQAALHKAELHSTGFNPQHRHRSLVERHTEVEQLQARLREVQARLDTFHGLPASQDGAQLQVRQCQENLASLQQRLHSALGLQG